MPGYDPFEIYQRNKIRGSQRETGKVAHAFSFKEWITFSISCTAFVLSALTTYSNAFRISDDLGLFTNSPPSMISSGLGTASAVISNEWIFTNAGNRAASIIAAYWVLSEYTDKKTNNECQADVMFRLPIAIKPFTIQSNQVENKHVEFEGVSLEGDDAGAYFIRIPDYLLKKKKIDVISCYEVIFATPEDEVKVVRTIYRSELNLEASVLLPNETSVLEKNDKRWSLLKQTRSTIFR